MLRSNEAAGSGVHPADDQLPPLDGRILEDVCRLGHLPNGAIRGAGDDPLPKVLREMKVAIEAGS